MALTSDEVNLLIYRYLQESGFQHTAYTFGSESSISTKFNINMPELQLGALISLIQKGLQFKEIEVHLNDDGTEKECDAPFSAITPHICHVPTKRKREEEREREREREREKEREREREREKEREKEKEKEREKEKDKEIENSNSMEISNKKLKIVDEVEDESDIEIKKDLIILEGHSSEVFSCSWNPNSYLLASGSGDSTARIWNLTNAINGKDNNGTNNNNSFHQTINKSIILKHTVNSDSVSSTTSSSSTGSNVEQSQDVTTLDWNSDGTLLATGSYDGIARIWNEKGELLTSFQKHTSPILSLKWNRKSDLLLSGSLDHSAIVWDIKSSELKQIFDFHEAPTLDVDWRNNISFATCSTDKMIYICEVNKLKPLKTFKGHKDEVNCIKWDPSGNILASCSDDCTVKLWTTKSDRWVHDFQQHKRAIYTLKWSPTGSCTNNPNKPLLLASASYDSSIKLWDVEAGECLYTLTKHTEPVYSVAFNPTGEYLASGSFDNSVRIWSVRDGSLVRVYKGMSGVFEVSWSNRGDRVAASFSDSSIRVLDLSSLMRE